MAIVILVTVVVHAQLSSPSPFRVFLTDPPVTFIAHWPYILLPGFLVPLAWPRGVADPALPAPRRVSA